MERPLRALRYLTVFRCVADACVDTCCAGLRVPVDRATLGRLEDVITDGDPLQVHRHLERAGADAAKDEAATIRMKADGTCPFLDPQRLCAVQRRYGVEGLGDACTFFPRALREGHEATEVTGSLACPETMRLLFSTPRPLDWEDLSPDALPRAPASSSPPSSLEAALRPHGQALVRGLLETTAPLGARWLLAGELCVGFTGRGMLEALEPEQLQVLHARWETHPTGARLAHARQLITALDLPLEKLLVLLATLVTERRALPHPSRFAACIERAGAPESWPARFLERSPTLDARTWGRLERNLALVAANSLLRHPVALEADPGLALGTVMLRSALAAMVLTLELHGQTCTDAELDARSVETLQPLAKSLDSHPILLDQARAFFDVPSEERMRRMLLLALVFPRAA